MFRLCFHVKYNIVLGKDQELDKLDWLQANPHPLSSSFDQALKINCQSGVHCFALIFIFAEHNRVVKLIKRPVVREFIHDF